MQSAYSSLPNRRDITAINFLRIFHPQLCCFSQHVYQKWLKLRNTTLIPGTTFIKIKKSSSSASRNSIILPPRHSKLENVFDFHIKVKIKLFIA